MPSRKSDKRKKQTRLTFNPISSSSPQKPENHVRFNDATTPRKRRRIGDSASDSDVRQLSPDIAQAIALSKQENLRVLADSQHKEIDQLPTPEPSSQIEHLGQEVGPRSERKRGVNAQKPIAGAATRSSKTTFSERSTVSSDEEPPVRSSRRTRPTRIAVDSSNNDSEPITPTVKRTRKSSTSGIASSPSDATSRPTSSRAPTARSFLAGSAGNAPVPRSRRRFSQFTLPKRVIDEDSDSNIDEEDVLSTSGNTQKSLPRTANNPRTRKEVAQAKDTDETSDEILTSPIRRRANKRRSEEQSEEDEDSMLEELGNAEDDEEAPNMRTRGQQDTSARSKRLEGLAKLRQRRAGVIELPEDDEGDEEGNDEEEDENETPIEEFSAEEERPSKTLDDYDSDFVEDDGEIGVDLMKHGVPLKFTGHANKKPFDYFKDEIEWMVHNKLDPAFERHDEIYEMAHRKLNDEVLALAGSEFNSSVWRENFTKALKTRPELFTTPVGFDAMEERCEACNRSKHPPKWMITFSGPTYDMTSLEKVSKKDADESDSSSEDASDEEEEEKEERWHVGSVCCGNAEIAHTLYHWRYQLNATVLHWLTVNGYTTAAKIVERENWSRKKREKLANKVVDGMVETGEMRSLYQQFKQNLDAARAAKAERVER